MATLALSLLASASPVSATSSNEGGAVQNGPVVTGYVFLDENENGALDRGERGIAHASVSNGKEVVQTDGRGRYSLPAYDEMVVFVTKPSGFAPPLNQSNVPQFFYLHHVRPDPQRDQGVRGCPLKRSGPGKGEVLPGSRPRPSTMPRKPRGSARQGSTSPSPILFGAIGILVLAASAMLMVFETTRLPSARQPILERATVPEPRARMEAPAPLRPLPAIPAVSPAPGVDATSAPINGGTRVQILSGPSAAEPTAPREELPDGERAD
jgi:hypothetical protein